MHDDELWQIYNNNGTPICGKGAHKEEFNSDKNLIMSNAHVWFWKIDEGRVSILLQKRLEFPQIFTALLISPIPKQVSSQKTPKYIRNHFPFLIR